MKSSRLRRMAGAVIVWMTMAVSGVPSALHAREAFWVAIQSNDALAVRAELGRGINPNLLHPEFGPAIVVAAKDKAFEVVRLLASLDATQLDATNRSDETALMLVCMLGDIRTAQYLMDRGAQVNRPGWTPLHYAATGGHDRLVRILLDRHAFIDAESPNLTTPLMMAARMKFPGLVRLLIEEGADPTPRNQAGLDAAAYLQRAGLMADAVWLRERAMQYILRYGTTEQPRRAEAGEPAQSEASQSVSSTPANGAGAFSAVPLARESLVVDESASQAPRTGAATGLAPGASPGKANTSAGTAPTRPAAAAPPGTAAPSSSAGAASPGASGGSGPAGQRPATKPADSATNRSATVSRGSTAVQGTTASKAPAPPAGIVPIAPAANASAGGRPAGSTALPVAPSATGLGAKPPAAVAPPAPIAPTAPAAVAGAVPAPPARAATPIAPVPAVVPVQPVEPEPVFVSRTLTLPEEPAAGGPSSSRVEPRAR